jgi:hypothetical protein
MEAVRADCPLKWGSGPADVWPRGVSCALAHLRLVPQLKNVTLRTVLVTVCIQYFYVYGQDSVVQKRV